MNQLALETLHQIFSLLHQNEKVECMLVCRRWATLIKSRSLYNTLQISDMSVLKSLISQLQTEPSQQNQVENLILNLYIEEDYRLTNLLTSFPNLRSMYLLGSDHKHFQRRAVTDLHERKLEHIAETLSHTLTMTVLSTSLCPRLKTLSVNATELGIPGRLLISLLINAPHLKEISMSAFGISFDDMELLHATLPSLTSVELGCTLLMDRRLPANILPAIHTTTFTLEAPDSTLEVQMEWLRYIRLKYTRLVKYGFGNPFSWPARQQQDRLQRLTPLIQGFGSQLKTLWIRLKHYDPHLFQALDEGSCHLEDLKLYLRPQDLSILGPFSQSSQAGYIHTLTLNVLELNSYGFGWLRDWKGLRKLALEYDFKMTKMMAGRKEERELIPLNELLEVTEDRLETLAISNARISVTEDIRVFSLEGLELSLVDIPETMDRFIATRLPKLRSLRLSFCGLDGRHFDLRELGLSYVEISEGIAFKNTYILVVSEKEKRWYTSEQSLRTRSFCKRYIGKDDSVVYPASKSVPFEQWTGPKSMTLTCASVNKLVVLSP